MLAPLTHKLTLLTDTGNFGTPDTVEWHR